MNRMAVTLTTVLILFILAGLQMVIAQDQEPAQTEEIRDGVFVHISHAADDPHRLLMGLQMAALMSETQDVLVYFDIKGVDAVVKTAENYSYSHFPKSLEQIEKLKEAGVIIMACPGCLKAAGYTAEDLLPGVKVADKQAFFNFTRGRILTLDY